MTDDTEKDPTCVQLCEVKTQAQKEFRCIAEIASHPPWFDNGSTGPSSLTYSSVVSRDSVRLAFLIAELNGLDVMACDVGNAYLNAPCREKIWFKAGQEHGDQMGKVMVVTRALYGLKSSGASWRQMFADSVKEMHFVNSIKYYLKSTQKQDEEEHIAVKEALEKSLVKFVEKTSENGFTKSSNACSRLLSASFAHQSMNVVGPAMASLLTRKKSRFIFSHETAWCPLRAMKVLVQGGNISAIIQHNGNTPYYVASVLHYLCRPEELGDVSAYDFYTQYEIVNKTAETQTPF